VPYTELEYAERFHKSTPGDPIAWPPNEGAVTGTKLDYGDAYQFVLEFGDTMDRLGEPTGKFMALVVNRPAFYEPRAIHYGSLYEKLHTYALIPGSLIPGSPIPRKLPKGWKIRVMETERALGQPGGSLGLVFIDGKGNQVPIKELIDPRNGVLAP
jgi:hypothetical protein